MIEERTLLNNSQNIYAFNLENRKLYRRDDIDVNGPKNVNNDVQVNNWWTPQANSLYNMFSTNIKYEDMIEEVYPTNVKAYKTDAVGTNHVS